MKKSFILLLFASLCIVNVNAQKKIPHTYRPFGRQATERKEIILPQVNGYNVYKADFHIHTSYSDGRVNPDGRVLEAWYDGLDIIAITDHYEGVSGIKKAFKVVAPQNGGEPIEYKSAKQLNAAPADFNAIHEEAARTVQRKGYDMLLVKGCEMARNNERLGHYNVLFAKDLNSLYRFELKEALQLAKKQGYTTTVFGRRRYIPELSAQNAALRAFGKRIAMNAPIQGAAADIMKLAMIKVHKKLKDEVPDARIVMQVHDELVIEVRDDQIENCRSLLKAEMESAAELSVPLTVDVTVGKNWLDQN